MQEKLCYEPEVKLGHVCEFLELRTVHERGTFSPRPGKPHPERQVIDVQSFMWVAVKWSPDDVRKAISAGI